jgi:histidyl-tRNA synthetase
VARSAFELTHQARRAGLQAQLELTGRSLKGQLKHADRLGARYVAIVGDNGHASLKDMQSGEQRDTELQNVIPTILRGSRLS